MATKPPTRRGCHGTRKSYLHPTHHVHLCLSPAQGARAFSEAEGAQLAAVLGLDSAGVRAVVDVSVEPARYRSTRHFELSCLELDGVL